MNFFDNDEKVIWKGTPNKKYVYTHGIICLITSIIFCLLFAIINFAIGNSHDSAASIIFIFECTIIVLIHLAMYIVVAIPFKHKQYIITNKKIYIKTDFLGSRTISLDIEEIKGFEYLRTISDKWFNLAGVDFHSPSIHIASYNGSTAANSKFAFMHLTHEDAEHVLKVIKELKAKNKEKKDN